MQYKCLFRSVTEIKFTDVYPLADLATFYFPQFNALIASIYLKHVSSITPQQPVSENRYIYHERLKKGKRRIHVYCPRSILFCSFVSAYTLDTVSVMYLHVLNSVKQLE